MTTTGLTNRMIAERAGWRVEPIYKHVAYQWYAIYAPDGTPQIRVTSYGRVNEWPEYDVDDPLPDYLRSTDAALALPLDAGDVIELQALWDGTAAARIVRSITGEMGEWQSGTAAAAICAAWWAWREAQEDE